MTQDPFETTPQTRGWELWRWALLIPATVLAVGVLFLVDLAILDLLDVEGGRLALGTLLGLALGLFGTPFAAGLLTGQRWLNLPIMVSGLATVLAWEMLLFLTMSGDQDFGDAFSILAMMFFFPVGAAYVAAIPLMLEFGRCLRALQRRRAHC